LEALKTGEKSSKKNTAFKPTYFSVTAIEDKKIEKIRKKMKQT